MHLCYIDESGTPDVPGNTSHFVLAGLAIPIWHWNDSDRELRRIKGRFSLNEAEIHTAWLLRKYQEQARIPDFENLGYADRRSAVTRLRNAELLRLQRSQNSKLYKQTRKNYRHTEAYIHLTYSERRQFVLEVAQCVSQWGFARLFAECVDKLHFDPSRTGRSIDEQAFEQVVSRFEQYLQIITNNQGGGTPKQFGLLIHDNNQTVARKHTQMMRGFHRSGTLWTSVSHIIETPLFVDSQLTGLVQIADLCSYAIRRYLENGETELFSHVFNRADRRGPKTVGIRHFSEQSCVCDICASH